MSGISMVVAIFGVIILSAVGTALWKKKLFSTIYGALEQKDYDNFFKKLDSKSAKAMLPPYTREMLRLTAYIRRDEDAAVTEQFNRMMKMELAGYQLCELLVKGFQYYQGVGNAGRCCKISDRMQEVLSPEMAGKYRRHCEIVFQGSDSYKEELEEGIGQHQGRMQGYLEYLLAKTCKNQNDMAGCQLYLRRAAAVYKTTVSELDRQVRVI